MIFIAIGFEGGGGAIEQDWTFDGNMRMSRRTGTRILENVEEIILDYLLSTYFT